MTNQPDSPQSNLASESPNGRAGSGTTQNGGLISSNQTLPPSFHQQARLALQQRTANLSQSNPSTFWITITAIAVMVLGLIVDNFWIGISGAIVALLVSLQRLYPALKAAVEALILPQQRSQLLAILAGIAAIAGLLKFVGFYHRLDVWAQQVNWDASGTLAEWFGALGQILIAILAVYIAWQQYVISRDLTIEQNRLTTQQNVITQQQTIDAYFQGISELALDDEGFLEDWPQEQAFAEGRTAALLGSVDSAGKAKVLRFLSQSKLLTPLKRDRRLGRPILNGDGGYEEDRAYGVRVIDLGVMLAGADLAGNDLRWTDLSEANLVRANLSRCDLVKANLSRTILYEANLTNADFKGTRLFYGPVATASPRSRIEPPDYRTGAHTGAVVENADFTGAKELSEAQRQYCCTWGGERTRGTIPGGCEGIPNKLGR
jgi:uncharacterized protein YjbI with pentapeptide repeats